MTEAKPEPVFPDCRMPHDCRCAARGYGLERDGCAVPRVAAAAEALGIDPAGVVRGPTGRVRSRPKLTATRSGTVQVLDDTGDLARDVLAGLEAVGTEPPFGRAELDRVLRAERIGAGLRAEAGYGGGGVVILHSRYEKLANGQTLRRWLTLSRTPAGDAVYWNVATSRTDRAVSCGEHEMMEALCEQVRLAAGGRVGEASEHWCEVPSEAGLAELERY